MQSKFKSRAAFIEWRAHWRSDYREVSESIRMTKSVARKPTNNSEAMRAAQSDMRHFQTIARSLLMAREAVLQAHDPTRFAEREAYRAAAEIAGRLKAAQRKAEARAKYESGGGRT